MYKTVFASLLIRIIGSVFSHFYFRPHLWLIVMTLTPYSLCFIVYVLLSCFQYNFFVTLASSLVVLVSYRMLLINTFMYFLSQYLYIYLSAIVVGCSSFHNNYSMSSFYPGLLIQVIFNIAYIPRDLFSYFDVWHTELPLVLF